MFVLCFRLYLCMLVSVFVFVCRCLPSCLCLCVCFVGVCVNKRMMCDITRLNIKNGRTGQFRGHATTDVICC